MARGMKPKLSTFQWVLLALILLSLSAWAAMVIPWIQAAPQRTQQAMEDGFYAHIALDTGEIQGKTPPSPPKKEDQKQPIVEKPAPTTTAATPPPAPVTIAEETPPPAVQAVTPTTDMTPPSTPVATTAEAPTSASAVPTIQPETPVQNSAEPSSPSTIAPTESAPIEADATKDTTETPHTPEVGEALNIARNAALEESYNGKVLPVISKDGTRASQYYSRPDDTPHDAPVIALAISGLGLHNELTQQAIKDLPAEVSLSFTPYAKGLDSWRDHANKAGHEAWIDVPMEYADYPANDPGPMGLLKGVSEQENITRLKNALSSMVGYVGVIAPKDEIFTGYAMMQAMSNELMQRGLLLLLRSRAFKPDNDAGGVLYSSRSLIKERTRAESLQSLQELETIAKDYGYAVGVVDASPALFTLIQEWHKDLASRKIQLVPLSAIPHRRK